MHARRCAGRCCATFSSSSRDQYIGSLLSANDNLVKALMAFEVMDKSIDDDSDSANETDHFRPIPHSPTSPRSTNAAFAGLSIEEKPPAKPPQPAKHPNAAGASIDVPDFAPLRRLTAISVPTKTILSATTTPSALHLRKPEA